MNENLPEKQKNHNKLAVGQKYASLGNDGEYHIGRVNPMVGKLAGDMEQMKEEMRVMQMIMRGFSRMEQQ